MSGEEAGKNLPTEINEMDQSSTDLIEQSSLITSDSAASVDTAAKPTVEQALERDRAVINDFFTAKIPRWLENSKWDRRESIGKKKFVFIDLSGTMHIENLPTRDAVKALACLRDAGFKVLFLTNTTKESRRLLYNRLIEIGFSVNSDEIFTSLNASRRYVEKHNLRPYFMVARAAMEDFQGIPTNNPNAVLVGLSAEHFNYPCMNEAWRLLALPDTQLLAVHKGRDLKCADGWDIGPGPFVYALEVASQKKAIILGKPESEFFASAMHYVGCDNVMEAVMIGDDIRDDVLGAMKLGMTGIWVQTGKSSSVDKIHPHKPDFAVPDFADAVALILEKTAEASAGDNKALSMMAAQLRYKPSPSGSDKFVMLR